jgi:hypothetical protein
MSLTREEVFALIDETIYNNNSKQIEASEVNALLKAIYDNAPVPTSPIKVLRARITQSGTSAPTFNLILENTIGTVEFSYIDVGMYRLNGSFPIGKVYINFFKQHSSAQSRFSIVHYNNSFIDFRSTQEYPYNEFSPLNSGFNSDFIEIIVYP